MSTCRGVGGVYERKRAETLREAEEAQREDKDKRRRVEEQAGIGDGGTGHVEGARASSACVCGVVTPRSTFVLLFILFISLIRRM